MTHGAVRGHPALSPWPGGARLARYPLTRAGPPPPPVRSASQGQGSVARASLVSR